MLFNKSEQDTVLKAVTDIFVDQEFAIGQLDGDLNFTGPNKTKREPIILYLKIHNLGSCI